MQIFNNVFPKNINLSFNSSKSNIVKTAEPTQAEYKYASVNSQNFQSYNNISFGNSINKKAKEYPVFLVSDSNGNMQKIASKVSLPTGEIASLNIDKTTVEALLSNTDGSVNQEYVQKFVSIYQSILGDLASKEQTQKQFLNRVIDGVEKPTKTNILYIDKKEEARQSVLKALSGNEDEFLKSVLSNITDEVTRKGLASHVLSSGEEFSNKKMETAYNRTVSLFEISRTSSGYDFSQIERKKGLLEKIEELQRNYGGIDTDISSQVIKASSMSNGEINLDFAENLCSLVSTATCYNPKTLVSHRADILKQFIEKDEANAKNISDYIGKLSALMDIDDSNNSFENAFESAFNPVTNKFDKEYADLLLELVMEIISYTDTLDFETKEDFDNCNALQDTLIAKYFALIKDEQGNIKSDFIYPDEFIEMATNN